MNYKICDKCRATSNDTEINRSCLMKHSPYYYYFGFDLCDNCFNELDKLFINFLNSECEKKGTIEEYNKSKNNLYKEMGVKNDK